MTWPRHSEDEFCDLLKDMKRGKAKHLDAARGKAMWHMALGVSSFLLSSLAAAVGGFQPDAELEVLSHLSVVASSMASVLVGLVTFLHLEKTVVGQRDVGNEYASLFREGKIFLAEALDGRVEEAKFLEKLEELRRRYDELNKAAAPYSVSRRSVATARKGDKEWMKKGAVRTRERINEQEQPG
ncbi:MAG: SLATT domain-containing protein [Nannocystaceae bacterium]|nr:SLATT domain-containing protein [bacterium]